jgi:membrane associated rhomboid family serine protease
MRPPQDWRTARATLAIGAITAAAWVVAVVFRLEPYAYQAGGFIPARHDGLSLALTPLTATLLHGGFVHLFFNLLFLMLCGRAVEAIVGARGLILLYVLGAYAAAAAQWVSDPGSGTPMVGASGAISALVGAYALLFGRNRTKIAHPTLAMLVHALWLAAAFIGIQLLIGYAVNMPSGGIAIAAHIGGFLIGLLLARPLLLLRWRGA